MRNGYLYEQVMFRDIIYLKAKRSYAQLATEKKTYLLVNTLQAINKCLPAELFVRVHHSCVVLTERIKKFDRDRIYFDEDAGGKEGLAKIKSLPIGPRYRASMRKSVVILQNRTGRFSKVLGDAAFVLEGEEMEID